MPMAKMSTLLHSAKQGGYGVGAFHVANMEMVKGVIEAAEEFLSPVILQVDQTWLLFSPLVLIGPLMVSAAEHASVPVAVHLGNGLNLETLRQALEIGFTSVMIDASHLPLEDNIALTRQVQALAKAYGADVEAGVGLLDRPRKQRLEGERLLGYQAGQIEHFYLQTHVEALGISLDNFRTGDSRHLDFSLLEAVRDRVPVPLAMKCDPALSRSEYRNCIDMGITKFNISGPSLTAVEKAAREFLQANRRDNFFALSESLTRGMHQTAGSFMKAFKSCHRA